MARLSVFTGAFAHMVEDIFDHTGRGSRIDIRTGIGRRRRWTAEQKAAVVAESFAPGAVVSAVARRHEISPQHLFQWRKAARLGHLVLPIDDEPLFAAVLLEQSVAQRRPDADIAVEVAGAVIHVRAGTDLSLLAAIVHALVPVAR